MLTSVAARFMAGSLLSASPEVLRDIVLHAIGTVGPPHAWYSLVLCCKTFRRQLDTPAMHALLFTKRFHVPADVYHLLPAHAKTELQRRFSALKFFKRGEQCLDDHESWVDALWLAYVMLRAEEPRQMNVDQLLWAGLPHLLLLFLKQRLNDGAEKNHGWPLANDTNSLAIALMWLLSSECKAPRLSRPFGTNFKLFVSSSVCQSRVSSHARRGDGTNTALRLGGLSGVHHTSFYSRSNSLRRRKYPLALASLQGECCGSGSTILPLADITTSEKVDEAYPAPLPPPSSREIAYFGPRTVHVPSAPVYSILCYFTRLDTLSPMFPVHLAAAGRVQVPSRAGPCREDVEHFINECRTRFEPWDFATETSIPRADDSLTRYLSQSYFPGSLTGRWQGSSIVCSSCHSIIA